jgi:hypothetical protein
MNVAGSIPASKWLVSYPIGNLGTRYRCFPAKLFHWPSSQLDRPTWAASHAFNTPTIPPISQSRSVTVGHGLAILATRKSRQGLPRRLVPLRLRRGTVSSGAQTQPVLALIWTHATFNEAGGCVASVSGQRSPILMTCDWRRCSSRQRCCPIR